MPHYLTSHHRKRSERARINLTPFAQRIIASPAECSAYCSGSPCVRTIKRLAAEGTLASTVIGQRRHIYVESFLAFLDRGRGGALREPPQLSPFKKRSTKGAQ